MKNFLKTSAAVLALGLLASCSGGDSPAASYAENDVETVLSDVKEAMAEVETLSVRATLKAPETGDETILEFRLNEANECEGSLSGPTGKVEFINTDEAVFLKADKKFWTEAAPSKQAAKKLTAKSEGKWVEAPQTGLGIVSYCDRDSLIGAFSMLDPKAPGGLKVGGENTSLDVPAIDVEEGANKFVVAAEAPHHVLKVQTQDGSAIVMSDFNEEVSVEAPAKETTVKAPKGF